MAGMGVAAGGVVRGIKDIRRGNRGKRSGKWRKVRREHLKIHPHCAVCGRRRRREVHHIIPFHTELGKELELEPENLLTLCSADHFTFGHLRNWQRANVFVLEDAKKWYLKLEGGRHR